MSRRQHGNPHPEGSAAATQYDEDRLRERRRCAAILRSPEAEDRGASALHLAIHTDMTPDEAIATLRMMPATGPGYDYNPKALRTRQTEIIEAIAAGREVDEGFLGSRLPRDLEAETLAFVDRHLAARRHS